MDGIPTRERGVTPGVKNCALIPYSPNFEKLNHQGRRRLHEADFRRKREGVLAELRVLSGLPDLIQTCNQDVLYKVVVPSGGLLQQNKTTGQWSGVLRNDDGTIQEHAQFKEIRPNAMAAIKAVGSQVLLISIAMQLNELQSMVESLALEMHRDRISAIHSGEDQLSVALEYEDEATRKIAISNAIQTLHTGLNSAIDELRVRIAQAPSPENKIRDHLNPLSPKLRKADKAMALAAESLAAVEHGLQVLCECYAALAEPAAIRKAAEIYLSKIAQCDIATAARKARLAEFHGPVAPQVPWQRFLDLDLQHMLIEPTAIEIEFMPHEITGATR